MRVRHVTKFYQRHPIGLGIFSSTTVVSRVSDLDWLGFGISDGTWLGRMEKHTFVAHCVVKRLFGTIPTKKMMIMIIVIMIVWIVRATAAYIGAQGLTARLV